MLRRFSSQLIRLFEKWNAAPDPALGLNLPMARDIVFGSLEHIVWTARVQRREDQLDVEKLSRDLASAYLRAFGLDDRPWCSAEERSQGRAQSPDDPARGLSGGIDARRLALSSRSSKASPRAATTTSGPVPEKEGARRARREEHGRALPAAGRWHRARLRLRPDRARLRADLQGHRDGELRPGRPDDAGHVRGPHLHRHLGDELLAGARWRRRWPWPPSAISSMPSCCGASSASRSSRW